MTGSLRVLAAAAAALLCLGWSWPWSSEPSVPDDRPIEAPTEGYVTSKTCEACHPGPYASWHDSYHRTMTQQASRSTSLGDFEFKELVYKGEKFLLGHSEEDLWVEFDGKRGRTRRDVVLSTGSHHDQMYWFTTPGSGRDVQQLPFDWSRRLGRWIPARASFLISPGWPESDIPGLWNGSCIHCHTTAAQVRSSTGFGSKRVNYDTRVAEFGVACESCHGPAAEHVLRNANPKRRYELYAGGDDPTITNPRRLSHDRSTEVCGQCHSAHYVYKDAEPYRPGKVLAEHFAVVQYAFRDPEHAPDDPRRRARIDEITRSDPDHWLSTFWSDGMIRVSGREYNGLLESPCYQRGELSCISCHDLHQSGEDRRPRAEWANDQLLQSKEGNAACTQCHASYENEEALAEHTHHAPTSIGSRCYDCHMPHTSYGIQKAHRTHQIASPSVAASIATGRSNGCNQCHFDQSLGWTAAYLEAWYGIPAPELEPEQRTLSAGVDWALRGDAGQRALAAWTMGWDGARATAGSDWMIPYLIQLIDDPYDAVRFVAEQSLLARSEFADAEWSYTLEETRAERAPALSRARKIFWNARPQGVTDGSRAVLFEDGRLLTSEFRRLLTQRDDRPMYLAE